MTIPTRLLSTSALAVALALVGSPSDAQQRGGGKWDIFEPAAQHIARFESGYIKVGERFYLIGARQMPQPVEIFDFATKTWTTGAVSPTIMHHFQPVAYDGKIYVLGALTPEIDVYDFASGTWSTLPASANIPTQRAGVAAVLFNGSIIVIGGESPIPERMHTEVEAFNLTTQQWTTLAPLNHGRHGTGAIVHNGKIYIGAGSSRQGTGDKVQEVFTPGP